jgi:adenosine deaminase
MTPKIDLHCHLDGSLPLLTVQKLASRSGIKVPKRKNDVKEVLRAPEKCQDLAEYLTYFDLPVACLQTQENLREAAYDTVCEAAKEHVIYMELRFAPLLHTSQGLNCRQVVDAVTAGINDAKKVTKMEAGVIACAMRHHNVEDNIQMLRDVLEFHGRGLYGFDIAGDEKRYPIGAHSRFYYEAGRNGVPFTIHAGECGSVINVLDALAMGAMRIGHGIAVAKDARAMQECVNKKVCLELCPTSNLQTKAAESIEQYPFRKLLNAGVAVTVNTDNRTVSDTTLEKEMRLLRESFGLSSEEEKQLTRNSADYAFAPDTVKEKLIQIIEAYDW